VGLTLGAPWGLLALAALPALVGAYFLRRRQPPRVVSALFLWRSADLRAEAGPRLERFSREVSLALEALAVVAAALFVADARCGAGAPGPHLVVVVDGSLSMAARDQEKSAADRARDAVAALAEAEHASALTVVESGPRPTVLAGPLASPGRALAALEAWAPAQPAHDLGPALVLAGDLSGAGGRRVVLFTDGPGASGEAWPAFVEARSVGRPLDNLAFLAAQRLDEGGQATVTVRVGNFTATAREVPVRFRAEGSPERTVAVALDAGAAAAVRVVLRTAAAVEASLPEDALAEDSHLTLLPSALPEVTVALLPGLDAAAGAAVARAVAAVPAARLAPEGVLTVGPPGSAARVTLGTTGLPRAFLGPFFARRGHPVLDDLQLSGVAWTAGANPPGQPLLSMGEAVLVSEEEDGRLHLNLALARGNLQRTEAWPVLWGNLVREARAGVPGLPRKHLALGEAVPVVTGPGARWALQGPRGQARALLGSGAATLPALPPGRWTLTRDGAPVDALEVLALDARESDLRTRGPLPAPPPAPPPRPAEAPATDRPGGLVALALALLLADFWWTARAPGKAAPA